MSVFANLDDQNPDRFGSGFVRAVALTSSSPHACVGLAIYVPGHVQHWGENASLRRRHPGLHGLGDPLAHQSRSRRKIRPRQRKCHPRAQASTQGSHAASAQAHRHPDQGKDRRKNRPRSRPSSSPRRPSTHSPRPPTTKAATGDAATQLPQALTQLKNGTAMATVQDRTFGVRYAYYLRIVSQIVAQNWYTQEADPTSSQGKRVTVLFDINRDGVPQNIRIETKSGSPSLDASALHALQRVDNFGPLPAGDHITVEYSLLTTNSHRIHNVYEHDFRLHLQEEGLNTMQTGPAVPPLEPPRHMPRRTRPSLRRARLSSPSLHAQDWFHLETSTGAGKLRLAVASFKPSSADPATLAGEGRIRRDALQRSLQRRHLRPGLQGHGPAVRTRRSVGDSTVAVVRRTGQRRDGRLRQSRRQ